MTNANPVDVDSSKVGEEAVDQKEPKQDAFERVLELVRKGETTENIAAGINEGTKEILALNPQIGSQYNVLCLMDETSIGRHDADRLYKAMSTFEEEKDLLLVLHSPGGRIEPAYMISKLCRQRARKRFCIAVPRIAKSAATLICCGADEIHMGSLSELGPIDPQLDGKPLLALKASLEHLVSITRTAPEAASMIALYLSSALPIEQLGYYERITESAAQYAESLLAKVKHPKAAEIAKKLVYFYKDHGFVIDADEAGSIFTSVKIETPEYQFSDAIYQWFKLCQLFVRIGKRLLYISGAPASGAEVIQYSSGTGRDVLPEPP